MTLNEFLTDIANALRERLPIDRKINARDFVTEIHNACSHNYGEGYESGRSDGYGEGYDFGKMEVYQDFWDTYQDNGNREHYSYAFGGKGWTDATFKPKYDIRPGNTVATNMFAYSQITDLVSILNRQGVVLDTSQSTDIGALFMYCSNLITCPPIDASNAKHCGSLFLGCAKIDNIKLKLKDDGSQTFVNTFKYCNWLYSLEIDGLIGQDIDLQWSDLSKASVLSVINHLATDVTGKTATFKSGYEDNSDVKKAIATKPNWTISFV